ncbi:MAG: sensor histidine kinase [Gemmatimonadaceae bacterium]
MASLLRNSAAVVSAGREPAHLLLEAQRDRAERLLNGIRAAVLVLLAAAATAYAPTLTAPLDLVNVLVLAPTLLWTAAQYRLFYSRPLLPGWLGVVNPVVDITAVTLIIGGYAVGQSGALALRSPIFLAYFVILAARPIASSTSKAAAIAALAVCEYAILVMVLVAAGSIRLVESPVTAAAMAAVSPLDECAKLLLLGVAGGVATYATRWQERLATRYYRATRERDQLETRLAQAQLETLKLQLRPHFLFNTLNTITALIHSAPRTAEQMVSGLSELLRFSLGSAGEQEVSLARELEILQHYVAIQQVRFQDRLVVSIDVEAEARQATVPSFILQPLVENAIRHGIAPRAAAGRVDVFAARHGGRLELRVSDDGVGDEAAASRPEGVGLGNTRARLISLYGDDHRLEVVTAPGSGFSVLISIPFHRAAVAHAATARAS